MQLQDGKLYETANGQRFRVTKLYSNYFVCPKSTSIVWDNAGLATHVSYDLSKEVDERRWIPIRLSEINDYLVEIDYVEPMQIRKVKGRHFQIFKEVDRPSKNRLVSAANKEDKQYNIHIRAIAKGEFLFNEEYQCSTDVTEATSDLGKFVVTSIQKAWHHGIDPVVDNFRLVIRFK
jgi:hypothetical protein